MSLVWLPFSVSAEISLFSTDKDSCHEMSSTMSGHDMSGHDMSVHDMPVQSMPSVMSGQAAESNNSMMNNSMHESMMQKGCCDHCGNDCVACVGIASCGHSSNYVSTFILIDQYSFESHPLIQFSTVQSVQYHNQIITPDIRPPIV